MQKLNKKIVGEFEVLQEEIAVSIGRAGTLVIVCEEHKDPSFHDYEYAMLQTAAENLQRARAAIIDLAAMYGSEKCNRMLKHRKQRHEA